VFDWFRRRPEAYRDLTPEEVEALLSSGEVQIIDVRTAGEYARGHLPGARLVPLQEFPARLGEIEPGPVLLYCQSGHRSTRAAKLLAARGSNEVLHMRGGIRRWRGPVE
jgi:rhodanese-related sulfurtransferase